MKKTILALVAFTGLITVGCKKDKDPSRNELIIGTWKPSFFAEDKNKNQTLDANERQPITDSVVVGATYEFKEGGSGIVKFPYIGYTQNFSWKLYDGDQRLIFTSFGSGGNPSNDTSRIHTLTSGELIVESQDVSNGVNHWSGLKK